MAMSKRIDWRQRPMALGLLGLALMLIGWKISTYAPPLSPRAAEQAQTLAQVRALADDPALADKLDGYARRTRPVAPYSIPGRLVLLGGLALFVAAGVLMYRQAPREDEDEEGRVARVPDEDGVPSGTD
jgi:hypothetical protein